MTPSEFSGKLDKTAKVLEEELAGVRTGRANPALLENLSVEAYGTKMKLREVASVSSSGPQQIVVQPWDPSLLEEIAKSIRSSDLGFNPSVESNILRVSVPPLSDERRQELMKFVGQKLEESRQSVRNIRQDEVKLLSNLPSEDERFREKEKIEALVKAANARLEDITNKKREQLSI